MNAYDSKFHDGSVDGILIREKRVFVFLRTEDNEIFALVLDDVTRMRVDNFREGSSIFDIVIRQGEDLTRDDMNIYGYAATPDGEKSANEMLERMRTENRLALEINPSYGCECFLIAQAITLIDRAELRALDLF
jgi:hypothetical protein